MSKNSVILPSQKEVMGDLMVWDDGSGHQHADDTQIYNSTPSHFSNEVAVLSQSLEAVGSLVGAPQASAKPRKDWVPSSVWTLWTMTSDKSGAGSGLTVHAQRVVGTLTFVHFGVV